MTTGLVRTPLLLAVALGLAVVSEATLAAPAVERVVVLAPGADHIRPATAQLLGEFFRQEVAQDMRFELVVGGDVNCGDPACAVAAARTNAADRVLWCQATREGDDYVLAVTATQTSTGTRLGSARVAAGSEDELFVAVGAAVPGLLDALAAAASPAPDNRDPKRSDLVPGLPTIVHQPIERAPVGRDLRVEAEIRGEVGTREVYVMFQVGGSDRIRYTRLRPLDPDGTGSTYSSEIPSSALTSAGLRYYLRVTDDRGAELARFPRSGWWSIAPSTDPTSPVVRSDRPLSSDGQSPTDSAEIQATPAEGTPVPGAAELRDADVAGKSKLWWWIGGAAAVAVGGAVALLGGGGDGDPRGPVDPGPTSLPGPPDHDP